MKFYPEYIKIYPYKSYQITVIRNVASGDYFSITDSPTPDSYPKFQSGNYHTTVEPLARAQAWAEERLQGKRTIFWSATETEVSGYFIRAGYLSDSEKRGKKISLPDGTKIKNIRFAAEVYLEGQKLFWIKDEALWRAQEICYDWIKNRNVNFVQSWLS